jgi:hypothetical protein
MLIRQDNGGSGPDVHGPTPPPAPGAGGGAGGQAPPPYDAPPPDEPNVLAANKLAHTAWQNAHDRIAQQRGDTYQQYGYMVNPDGSVSVDPNNPFGKIQQLYRGQADEMDHMEHNQYGRGFAHSSGEIGQNLEDVQYGENLAKTNLGNSMQGTLDNLTYADTTNDFNQDNSKFLNQQLYGSKDIAEGNFNPYDPSTGNFGDGPDSTTKEGSNVPPTVVVPTKGYAVGPKSGKGPAAQQVLAGVHPVVKQKILKSMKPKAKGKR